MLHEILAQPLGGDEETGDGYKMRDGRHGSEDSGYFSRRGSKATITGEGKRDSVLTEAMEEIVEDYEGAEEADDEGADLEELDEDEEEYRAKAEHIINPSSSGRAQPKNLHLNKHHPQEQQEQQTRIQVGTRFISPAPRKLASPLFSSEEAVMSRARTGKGASI